VFTPPVSPSSGLVDTAPAVSVREIFRRFWPETRPFRRWLWVSFLLAALAPLIDVVAVWLFMVLIDDVLAPRNFHLFYVIGLAYVGITLAMGLVSFFDRYLSTWVAERFVLDLRTRLFTHLHGLSVSYFERRRLGDVLSRLTGDIAAIETLVLSGVANAVSNSFTLILFTGALFYLSWELAVVSLVVVPIFWLLARKFSRLIKQATREKRRRSGSITAVAEESLSNIALVQAYGQQRQEIGRFHQENVGSFNAEIAATKLRALFTPLVDLLELAGVLLVIGFGTWELAHGRITMGGLLAFLAFLSQLYRPVRAFGRLGNSVYAASASAERIIELLEERPTVREHAQPKSLDHARGVIVFDGVTFRYPGASQDALTDLTFTAYPGQMLALVGASGSGKSTLGKLLLRFYAPGAGTIRLDGHDLRQLALRSLRQNIAVVMQETLVLDSTIRENILWGRPDADYEDMVRAARAADAHAFISSLPDGYDTRVGQHGRLLSGGQRQRIALARAMIRDASILLMDEPTTGLDAASSERIVTVLRRLMAGRTTIVVSHNLLTVREASQILVMDHGRVTERGTHDELIARNGRYARMYRLHQPEPVVHYVEPQVL